jgi:hypothetical protein
MSWPPPGGFEVMSLLISALRRYIEETCLCPLVLCSFFERIMACVHMDHSFDMVLRRFVLTYCLVITLCCTMLPM